MLKNLLTMLSLWIIFNCLAFFILLIKQVLCENLNFMLTRSKKVLLNTMAMKRKACFRNTLLVICHSLTGGKFGVSDMSFYVLHDLNLN